MALLVSGRSWWSNSGTETRQVKDRAVGPDSRARRLPHKWKEVGATAHYPNYSLCGSPIQLLPVETNQDQLVLTALWGGGTSNQTTSEPQK